MSFSFMIVFKTGSQSLLIVFCYIQFFYCHEGVISSIHDKIHKTCTFIVFNRVQRYCFSIKPASFLWKKCRFGRELMYFCAEKCRF